MEVYKRCPKCSGFPLKVDSRKSWLTKFILATLWVLFCAWTLTKKLDLLLLISGSAVAVIGLYYGYRFFFVKNLYAKCEQCGSRWLWSKL